MNNLEVAPGVPNAIGMRQYLELAKAGDEAAFRQWLRGATYQYGRTGLKLPHPQALELLGQVEWDSVRLTVKAA